MVTGIQKVQFLLSSKWGMRNDRYLDMIGIRGDALFVCGKKATIAHNYGRLRDTCRRKKDIYYDAGDNRAFTFA